MKKISLGLLVGVVAIAGIFCIAGNWAWWNAWSLIILMAIIGTLTSRLFNKISGLTEERKTAAAKSKPWDVKIVRFLNIVFPLMLFVAAFDMRFHWFPTVPIVISVTALILVVIASVLTYLAIAANPFFSSHIRIQKERGHIAISSGPYRWIRHPGYAGSLIFNLSVPFALGSWPPLLLGITTALLLIFRTAKEDRILTKELVGYPAYAQQVRYRLIPGIW
jgi:protein-S-isoprenylcysteine O-methyltransferase Ste14